MADLQAAVRERAKALLSSGEVGYVIGWKETRFPGQFAPGFAFSPEEADGLCYNNKCANMIASYLLDDRYPEKKIGLFVRGCESRGVNRMLKDGQVRRENLYLIGLPCEGVTDENGALLDKCAKCTHRNPLVYDELLGGAVPEQTVENRFTAVLEMEGLSPDEKYEYWAQEFDRCIRCYACRNVCPACNCTTCYVDQNYQGWQGKQHSRDENQIYGLTRTYHIGPRCIECGECERVCPMHLPLMKLNRKLVKDINELFGEYEGGLDDTTENALGVFEKDDLEEFM